MKTKEPLIRLENLKKVYGEGDSQTTALLDVDFSINEGEFVAIMGASGSGKSTLLHILGFLDKQTSGIYYYGGKNNLHFSEPQLAALRNKELGFVFQAFHLLPKATVLENVLLPLAYSDEPESQWERLAREAISAVDLNHRVDHLAVSLSGGEKQRVAIARALVNNPSVIFADEPTGNLDSVSGKKVMEIIHKLNSLYKRTVILITHETSTAEHAERIIKIKDGRVVSDEAVKNRRAAEDDYSK